MVGPRSDVYSLGALLYELLTRRPPIVGVNQLETLRLIASEDPRPIRELRPDVPLELEAICLKCLEKSPDRRYATAADLASDLRRFLAGETVAASPQGRLRRPGPQAAAATGFGADRPGHDRDSLRQDSCRACS